MRRLVHLTLALALSACAQHALPPPAATSSAAAEEPHVANVLRGLRPPVEVAGRPPVRWTLEERMAHHHVPGVSIAVIEGGRIAWVRGIGVTTAGSLWAARRR